MPVPDLLSDSSFHTKTIAKERKVQYADRINRTADRTTAKYNRGVYNKILSRIIHRYDPLLSVNSHEEFVVKENSEYEEVLKGEKMVCQIDQNRNELQSDDIVASIDEDQTDGHCLNSVEKIVVSKPVAKNVTLSEKFQTKSARFNKVRHKMISMKLLKATSLPNYLSLKYLKKFKNKRFKGKPSISRKMLTKLNSSLYRRHIPVKKKQYYKYKTIRRNFLVPSKYDRFLFDSRKLKQLHQDYLNLKLPKITHSPELLREIALHSHSLIEHRGPDNTFPYLTVGASDILATSIQVFIRDQILKFKT